LRKAKRSAIPTNAGAPASHQRSPSHFAKPITITSARQIDRNSPPSASQPPKIPEK